jgi:hypothetical protein
MTDSRAWLRRAGRGRDAAGWLVVWSVAEGRRGRRWREVRQRDGAIASSLLLETDPDGRFSHTELSTPSGLLTLHPEGDGTLHGNVVATGGLRHVRGLPWDVDAIVLLEGSTLCQVAAAARLARDVPAAAPATRRAAVIPSSLRLSVEDARIEHIDEGTWRFGSEAPLRVDADGLPVLDDAESWPLEE